MKLSITLVIILSCFQSLFSTKNKSCNDCSSKGTIKRRSQHIKWCWYRHSDDGIHNCNKVDNKYRCEESRGCLWHHTFDGAFREHKCLDYCQACCSSMSDIGGHCFLDLEQGDIRRKCENLSMEPWSKKKLK